MRQKKKRGGKKINHPVYLVQYLAKNNHKGTWPKTYSKTCRDHGPRLGTKERKTMQKKKKKIHIRKSRSNLENTNT